MLKNYLIDKYIVFFLMFVLCAGCSSIHKITIDESKVISYSYMEKDANRWEDLVGNINRGETVIILIPKGTILPLRSKIETPVVVLEDSGKNKIHFKRDVYVYTSKKKMLISPDGKRWSKIHDKGAMKELFGFSKGNLNIGFGAVKDTGAFMSLSIETE